MVGLDEHLKDPLYANWVRNTRALNIVNSVLQPYVYDEVVNLHKSIISRCPAGVTCGSCSWRRAPRCPNNFCNIIKIEIEENHRHRNPSFDNTNARDWKSDAWEVAKCFMPVSRGYRECTSSDADFSAIVNIVINCKAFDELVWCDLDQPGNIFSKTRGIRNYLMHSDEQEVSECDLESNLDLFICILNDFKTKPPKSPEAIDKITELKADKITTEDVIDARTRFLLDKGATTEYVDDEIAKLRKEIEEAESIWKAPQHKLIDKFVKGCKHSLVKIMESQIDMVRPSRRPHQEWNLCKFLDKIELDSDVKSLSQLHWHLLYPDDGSKPDINNWDLFLLCHILSIESIFQLDNNLKTYIKEMTRIRDKIISNSDKLAEEDPKVLADFLEEPLRTEIINIYDDEDIKVDAVKLQSVLTFWRQEEINMEHEQINTNTLKQNEEVVARVDVLENKVLRIFDLLKDRTEIGSLPEGYGQGIESHIKLKPKHCDKKEEEQVQDNMTTKDEGVNISIANGGIREFCEQMNLKTAQPFKGSIILKVTCKSIKDLVSFWDSCTDGRALRALSKVRDDYRKFIGCDTLDFDIVLSKKEVNRCMDYLVDRLSSLIPDISVLEKVLDTQPLLEIVPASVEAKDASKEKMDILTGESDRKISEDVQQVEKEGTTPGEILKQTRVSLEEVHGVSEDVHDVPQEIHDVSEDVHDVPKEIHDVPEEMYDVPAGRKGLILEEVRPAEGIKQSAYEEKCMRESIQHHITTLVNTLVFKESKIPDMIIQHGMATSSECEKLRKLPTLEDQVSGLVSMVIQRDISCMRHFLDIVKEQNPCVVNEILETFDYSTQNSKMVALPCVACELKQKCDIKSVYNHFFEEKLISYSLHSKIVYDPSPIGAQGTVWDELLNELAEQPAAHVVNVFIKALNNNNFHSNLIHMLERLLRKKSSVKCRCQYQSLVDNRQNRTANKDCTDQTNENYAYTINTVARQEVETQAEDSVNTHRRYNSESTEDTTDPKQVYTERKSNIHEVNTQNNRSYNLESTEDNTDPKEVCTERKSNIHEVNTQNDRSYNSESTVDNTDPKEVYTERKSNIYETIWQSTSDLERKSNIQEVSKQNSRSYNLESTEDTTDPKEVCTEGKSNIYEAIWPSASDSPLKSTQSYELTIDETTPETAMLMVNNITPTATSQEVNKDEPKSFMTKDKLSGNEERSGLQKKTKCQRNQFDIKKMKQIHEHQMATDRMTHL